MVDSNIEGLQDLLYMIIKWVSWWGLWWTCFFSFRHLMCLTAWRNSVSMFHIAFFQYHCRLDKRYLPQIPDRGWRTTPSSPNQISIPSQPRENNSPASFITQCRVFKELVVFALLLLSDTEPKSKDTQPNVNILHVYQMFVGECASAAARSGPGTYSSGCLPYQGVIPVKIGPLESWVCDSSLISFGTV